MRRDSLVEFIKIEFDRKKARNPAYSLRSLSRDLAIDASNLSKILSYQKRLGPVLKTKLAKKMGLSPADLESLSEVSPKTRDRDYQLHGLEGFKVIADWQHYAILELLKLKEFKPTVAAMGTRLGLSNALVAASIQRLKTAGLLKETPEGGLQAVDESSSSILNVATSGAHRNQQRQILEGAIDALEKTPIEWRSQSSMTVAIDTRKLEEARALIKKFRRDMGRLLSDSDDLDEVYQLSISLYPVSLNKKESL